MDVQPLTSWQVSVFTSLRPSFQQSLWICAYCSLSRVKKKKMCKDLSARVAGAKKGRGGWKAQNPNPPFASPFDTCHAGWFYLDKRTQNTSWQDSGWFPSRSGMGKKKLIKKKTEEIWSMFRQKLFYHFISWLVPCNGYSDRRQKNPRPLVRK